MDYVPHPKQINKLTNGRARIHTGLSDSKIWAIKYALLLPLSSNKLLLNLSKMHAFGINLSFLSLFPFIIALKKTIYGNEWEFKRFSIYFGAIPPNKQKYLESFKQ